MNIVVANSVGVDQKGYHMVHVPSRWSLGVPNFTNCGYYPWQLAYTSSLLKRETSHRIRFLDGVLAGWNVETYLQHIRKEAPDWLIMESSTRTIDEDLRLAKAVKKEFGTRLIFTGQHPMARPEEVLEVTDYVCIGEYEYAVLELVQGKDPRNISGVYPNARRELLDVDSLPWPEDEDIRRIDYHEPNCRYRQIQMYASRGCPRRCNFCAAATLYYDELNWRPRNVDDIVNEIRALKEKYPEMEGVFFDEEVHNIRKSFNVALARAIRRAGLDHLKYEALCEYASLDEEAMLEMREAGYYKIRFGIETGSDRVAESMTLGKKHDLNKLRSILEYGKTIGMVFYGTISVGGMGSSLEEDRKTVDLIYDLASRELLQEIQVSINTPQPGTDFYNQCLKDNLLESGIPHDGFDGNGHVVVNYPHYPAHQIKQSFKAALDAFDRGKAVANRQSFIDNAEQFLKGIPENASILLMRSVRPWMIESILDAVKRHRKHGIDVFGQDAVIANLKTHPGVEIVFSYGEGFFSINSISTSLLNQLRARQYDYVLVPVTNNHLEGYANVIEVAKLLNPKNITGIFPEGSSRSLIEAGREEAVNSLCLS